MTHINLGKALDPFLNIAKTRILFCILLCNEQYNVLDIAFKDAIKDVTNVIIPVR